VTRLTIRTGDDEKCRTYTYLECPACGDKFDLPRGNYKYSATLDARVLVCEKHTQAFDVTEELFLQESLQKALKSPRGAVTKDNKLLKISDSLKKFQELEATYGL